MITRRRFLHVAGLASVSGLGGLRCWGRSGLAEGPYAAFQRADLDGRAERLEGMDLFLLLGQSNMRGRGRLPPVTHVMERVVMLHLRDDRWYLAQDPLHAGSTDPSTDERDNAGVGPGMSFAKKVAEREPSRFVGLVPTARGGSRISQWQPGQSLYENAIRRARIARAVALSEGAVTIRAVLWLQGESDATDNLHENYEERLLKLIDGLRADLGQTDLPFIACTIPSFLQGHNTYTRSREVNHVLLTLPEKRPQTACVDARDLTGHIGDRVHFDSESQQVIGQRYSEQYFEWFK